MKSLIIKLAKKYILNAVNDLLSKNKDNTASICSQIKLWTGKLNTVSEQLSKIAERAEDGKLDDEEVDASLTEIETIIKNWTV